MDACRRRCWPSSFGCCRRPAVVSTGQTTPTYGGSLRVPGIIVVGRMLPSAGGTTGDRHPRPAVGPRMIQSACSERVCPVGRAHCTVLDRDDRARRIAGTPPVHHAVPLTHEVHWLLPKQDARRGDLTSFLEHNISTAVIPSVGSCGEDPKERSRSLPQGRAGCHVGKDR